MLLLQTIKKKILDPRIIWLIKTILANHNSEQEGKGMPLGNLTSQFFANVFLNELDQFVKYILKAKYYIRYVDDFVILDRSPQVLHLYLKQIDIFLCETLALELHPDKSKILPLSQGVEFLGMKIFPHHKLLKKKNLRKFFQNLNSFYTDYDNKIITYDTVYDSLEGWSAYARNANTFKLRKKIIHNFEGKFHHEISTKEVNRGRKRKKKRPQSEFAKTKSPYTKRLNQAF